MYMEYVCEEATENRKKRYRTSGGDWNADSLEEKRKVKNSPNKCFFNVFSATGISPV